jgi:hypothetical protein
MRETFLMRSTDLWTKEEDRRVDREEEEVAPESRDWM